MTRAKDLGSEAFGFGEPSMALPSTAHIFSRLALLATLVVGSVAPAQIKIYQLESVTLEGTDRLSVEDISRQLDLYPGKPLNDSVVTLVREKLLAFGLFKSVALYMRKGSAQGKARLIIEVEDDNSVLGSWAIGSELSVTSGEAQSNTSTSAAPAFGYRAEVLARNAFRQGYRANLGIDTDSKGIVREGHTAVGLPRFSKESTQFDGQVSIVDVHHRYLHALGFGQKGEAFWTQDIGNDALNYGVAMYLNRDRFSMPRFPKTVVGPKIGYQRETRLLGFVPSPGYGYGLSGLLPVGNTGQHVLEARGSYTKKLGQLIVATAEGKAMAVGAEGRAGRANLRLDLPVGRSDKTQEFAKAFLLVESGLDRYRATDLSASAMSFGLRYHSPGFIAEVVLKITTVPKEFEPLLDTGYGIQTGGLP